MNEEVKYIRQILNVTPIEGDNKSFLVQAPVEGEYIPNGTIDPDNGIVLESSAGFIDCERGAFEFERMLWSPSNRNPYFKFTMDDIDCTNVTKLVARFGYIKETKKDDETMVMRNDRPVEQKNVKTARKSTDPDVRREFDDALRKIAYTALNSPLIGIYAYPEPLFRLTIDWQRDDVLKISISKNSDFYRNSVIWLQTLLLLDLGAAYKKEVRAALELLYSVGGTRYDHDMIADEILSDIIRFLSSNSRPISDIVEALYSTVSWVYTDDGFDSLDSTDANIDTFSLATLDLMNMFEPNDYGKAKFITIVDSLREHFGGQIIHLYSKENEKDDEKMVMRNDRPVETKKEKMEIKAAATGSTVKDFVAMVQGPDEKPAKLLVDSKGRISTDPKCQIARRRFDKLLHDLAHAAVNSPFPSSMDSSIIGKTIKRQTDNVLYLYRDDKNIARISSVKWLETLLLFDVGHEYKASIHEALTFLYSVGGIICVHDPVVDAILSDIARYALHNSPFARDAVSGVFSIVNWVYAEDWCAGKSDLTDGVSFLESTRQISTMFENETTVTATIGKMLEALQDRFKTLGRFEYVMEAGEDHFKCEGCAGGDSKHSEHRICAGGKGKSLFATEPSSEAISFEVIDGQIVKENESKALAEITTICQRLPGALAAYYEEVKNMTKK